MTISDIGVPENIHAEIIKHEENIPFGYFGPIEIIYEPRVSLFTTTNVTNKYVKFELDLPDTIEIPTIGGVASQIHCYFGKDHTPASECTNPLPANRKILFKPPLNYDLSRCPVIITLTT